MESRVQSLKNRTSLDGQRLPLSVCSVSQKCEDIWPLKRLYRSLTSITIPDRRFGTIGDRGLYWMQRSLTKYSTTNIPDGVRTIVETRVFSGCGRSLSSITFLEARKVAHNQP